MNKRQIELLAQADLLLLVVDLLRPPEKIRHPLAQLTRKEVKSLLAATGLKGCQSITRQLCAAIELTNRTSREEWSGCYRTLFDGTIACPINEATYIRRDKGAIIGDVCGFYRAFGWRPINDTGERPDHLVVELEFVAMLLVMEAGAKTKEHRQLTKSALADFTRTHVSDWLGLFCDQLHISTNDPLFVAISTLVANVWQSLIAWHGWTVDPVASRTVGLCDEPEDPYECGAPDLVTLTAGKN
jgi:TorA maturation chaperone TorD